MDSKKKGNQITLVICKSANTSSAVFSISSLHTSQMHIGRPVSSLPAEVVDVHNTEQHFMWEF